MGFFSTLKTGQQYLKTWPLEPKLGAIFPENRVIKATVFAQKFMPFLAVFSVVWQQFYARGDTMALAVAVLTAIFALFLPLQGIYWLGKRAKTPLPPKSAVGFQRVFEKLKDKRIALPTFPEQPTYFDLATLLKLAQQKLGRDFWQDL
ncbi:terminus macrodomain insulation protein YfbV [Aggregatibacter kilianii]|uniref:terminus macrodomain insulation protein YfbV n=1 Tax=Aggregatibacter kilianii TaxID=2025884 RepID=UPI000D6579F3|nr:terminus macrodomain insulation protein YfbV [Aggregatibacter kilianii]